MDHTERIENEAKIVQALAALESFLRPSVREIVRAAREGFETDEYAIHMPDPTVVDMTMEELASWVVKTSNHFGQMSRLSGVIHASLKISDSRYKRAFKTAKVGKNEDERELNAMNSSSLEHGDLTIVEAAAEIVDALERSARIASESARKVFDKALAQRTAEGRVANHTP